jgi:hypothetical protein
LVLFTFSDHNCVMRWTHSEFGGITFMERSHEAMWTWVLE